MLTVLGGLEEFERELIKARTHEPEGFQPVIIRRNIPSLAK